MMKSVISHRHLLFLLALLLPFAAGAQIAASSTEERKPVQIPEQLTQAQVRDLVARLSDDQVRELVISQLDKLAVSEEQAGGAAAYVGQLRNGIQVAWDSLSHTFESGHKIHALPSMIWNGISDDGQISGVYLLFQLLGLLAVGTLAERLARRFLEKARATPVDFDSPGKRFDLACFGAAMGLLELGAFVGGAFLFVEITGAGAPGAQPLWHELIWCVLMIKLVLLAVRKVAAPGQAKLRLVSISDAAAGGAWAWALILMSALMLPLPLIRVAAVYGADAETDLFLRVISGAVFVALLVVLTIRLRRYGAALIAGEDTETGSVRQALARVWWMLTIVYLLVIWFMSVGKRAATGESTLVPGLGSLLLFALIPYFDMGLRWLISRFLEKSEAGETTAGAGEQAAQTEAEAAQATAAEAGGGVVVDEPEYLATALRYARVLMALAILAMFVRLWNIDVRALSSLLVGERFAGALFDIGITILLAWALWGVIRISIERKLADEKGPAAAGEEVEAGGLGGTRTETILPLIRVFIKITLIAMTVMICLSALGVNIGPLLAGAGVVGIAIGFGAQTLVRDIVSGFFYLLDDAFRIGEYVVIDQIRGTVEKISIRSFQLRHHEGPVHTIPYGEIRTLTNWSRDWAIMKFELRIPYETDIEKVRKLIKKIGLGMMEDPVYGPMMLAPLKSQGVNRMDDSALIIRCKFTAVPGQQYLIRREAFTRIQKAFEEEGIQFAPRRVLVEATSPQEAVKAAAGAIDREGEGEPQPKPGA